MNELTVREAPVAGDPGSAVRELTPPFAQGRRRVVLLIHGYNVTEEAARGSYAGFIAALEALGPSAAALLPDLGGFYWPGDADLGPLSFLSYPGEIEPAKDSAERLATYVRTLVGPGGTTTALYFVGHSLGNRVVLELLDRLAAAPSPTGHVAGACLMAAAVPVDMAEDGGPLRDGATLPGTTLVLYSRDDTVLHFAFPLGETLAGEGFFPTAVGRFGEPAGVWTERQELTGDDHGDYWADPRATMRVARLLGAAVPWEIEAAAMAERPLPAAPALPPRALAERTAPGSAP